MISPRTAEDSDRCHSAEGFQRYHPPQAALGRSEPFPASGWAALAAARYQAVRRRPAPWLAGQAQLSKVMRSKYFSSFSPYWNGPGAALGPKLRPCACARLFLSRLAGGPVFWRPVMYGVGSATALRGNRFVGAANQSQAKLSTDDNLRASVTA